MPGPLTGFRILDLTSNLSGPWGTMILGDQGADVIKVEMPGVGDHVRAAGSRHGGTSAAFVNLNRNKRSIAIDLKHERGGEVLRQLAATADVLVQNFRAGVVERLGIGEDDIRKVAPNIIYVSINGFGERGPYAHKAAYDPVIQALSGLTSIQGGGDDARPRLVRTVIPDKITAITAAQAITAALLARTRTGEGQHLRLSMLDAVIAFLWSSDMANQTFMDKPPRPQGTASAIDLIYDTSDGFMTVAVVTDKQWSGFARAAERPDLLDDPRFATTTLRDKNIDVRLALIQDILRGRTRTEWEARLDAESVPCAPVLTRTEMLDHPHVRAAGIIQEYDHPEAGRLRQARTPARFDRTVPATPRPAPRLGAHSAEILREAGLDSAAIADLVDQGVVEAADPDPGVVAAAQ